MVVARSGWVLSVGFVLLACSSTSTPPSSETDAAAPDGQAGRVAQGPSCKEYLRCLASVAPEAVGPAVGAYGPESGCWANAETAALCEGACTDARAKAGCNAGTDAGSDASTVGPDATYFVTCLTALSAGDTSKRFNFIATTGRTFRALPASATRVDLAEAVGSATKATERTTGQTTTLSFPTPFVIPATANPISARELAVDGFALEGKLDQARSCARMSGTITSPIRQPFDPSTDTCVFVAVKPGDALPQVTVAEHACK
ncbi:MAG: hypothetical protein JNM74_23600 [Myxococcales bacterium]|nr:hypothetical protein [Myxococcales bacterium]